MEHLTEMTLTWETGLNCNVHDWLSSLCQEALGPFDSLLARICYWRSSHALTEHVREMLRPHAGGLSNSGEIQFVRIPRQMAVDIFERGAQAFRRQRARRCGPDTRIPRVMSRQIVQESGSQISNVGIAAGTSAANRLAHRVQQARDLRIAQAEVGCQLPIRYCHDAWS